jgi:hypothetical protein
VFSGILYDSDNLSSIANDGNDKPFPIPGTSLRILLLILPVTDLLTLSSGYCVEVCGLLSRFDAVSYKLIINIIIINEIINTNNNNNY